MRDEPYPQNVELGSSLSCRRFFSFLGKGKGPSCSVGLAFFHYKCMEYVVVICFARLR